LYYFKTEQGEPVWIDPKKAAAPKKAPAPKKAAAPKKK
jgi:hypothetical protein